METQGCNEKNEIIQLRTRILMAIAAIIPIIIVCISYKKIPNMVPIHWGLQGVDKYTSKNTLFITGMIPVLIYFLSFLVSSDKVLKLTETSTKIQKTTVNLLFFAIEVFIMLIQVLVIIESLQPGFLSFEKVIFFIAGLFLIYVGNIVPKLPEQYLRIKFSKEKKNKEIKIKRLVAYIMMLLGFVLTIFAFLFPFIVSIIVIVSLSLICGIIVLLFIFSRK